MTAHISHSQLQLQSSRASDPHFLSDSFASRSSSTSSSHNQQLPSSLLALIASNLPPKSILRLQRCSSTQYRQRADGAYTIAAWRRAELQVTFSPWLHQWVISREQCIDGGRLSRKVFIPVTVWQAAVPDMLELVQRVRFDEIPRPLHLTSQEERNGPLQHVTATLQKSQLTRWISAVQGADGRWTAIGTDRGRAAAEAAQQVEVLSDIGYCPDPHPLGLYWMGKHDYRTTEYKFLYYDVDVRARLALQSCPHLQHLVFRLDYDSRGVISMADTFALVPRLRSLHLEQSRYVDYSNEHCSTLRPCWTASPTSPLCTGQASIIKSHSLT